MAFSKIMHLLGNKKEEKSPSKRQSAKNSNKCSKWQQS